MNCDISVLQSALDSAEESGPAIETAAEHVEKCAACRDKLAELGGDTTSWKDAAQWLASEETDDLEEADDLTDNLSFPVPDLSFLEPATSPEMLGNIGRYEIESVLGQGGMGIVLRAHDSDLQRTVAVKVLSPQWAASPVARRRFAREAQAAASVAHENVIPIYNVEASAQLPFLVMRYVPGMTLGQWVRCNEQIDVGTILRVAGQMAEGLAAAHRRGLIHRDIKPANVLVGENIERVWITDFGLARAADSVTLTQTGVIAGTPHYMSPEQARGEPIDQRSDLFSFGCVLFFMCSKRPPFDADNTLAVLHRIVNEQPPCVTQSREDLPPSLVKLIRQLLAPSVEQRTKDCTAIIEQLASAQDEYREGKCQRTTRPLIRPLFKVSAVCAGIVAFGSLWSISTTTNSTETTHQRFVTEQPVPAQMNLQLQSSTRMAPMTTAAARQITNSLNDASLASAVEQLNQDLEAACLQDEWIFSNPMQVGDSAWQRQLTHLQSEIATTETDSAFSAPRLVQPVSNWSDETNRIETSINRIKQSDSFNWPPP